MDRDIEIIEKIRNGDGELFHELIHRYKRAVYSLCMRMTGNEEDAKDLAQETFIKVYHGLDKYNSAYKFSTWILKIASNLCVDYHRKRKVQTLPLNDQLGIHQDTASAEDIYFHKTNKFEIERAIQSLPVEYRILIMLYHKDGLSYDEISKILNLPMSKVKNRLHRARKKLKEKLKYIKEEESIWTAKELQI